MNRKEYDEELRALRNIFNEDERILMYRYANANSDVKIGDFVTDHIGTIKVEKISFYMGLYGEYPECIYTGPEYTKKCQPKKNKSSRAVYQSNVGRKLC